MIIIIYPPLSSLLEKTDNRYTLVNVTAKRARQLIEGVHKLTKINSDKPVTIAINEIYENKIVFIRTKSGIK